MLFIIVLLKPPPEYKHVTSYNFRFVIDDSKLLNMYLIKSVSQSLKPVLKNKNVCQMH